MPINIRIEDPKQVRTARGELRIYALGRTAYGTEFSGHLEDAHVDLFLAYSEERIELASGKLTVFHDWLDMTGYDSSCRKRITDWTVKHLDAYAAVHVLLRSKLVAMGVQVANLALGGLVKTHKTRASLEAAVRAAVPQEPAARSVRPPRIAE